MNNNLKNFNNSCLKTITKRAIHSLKSKIVFIVTTMFLLLPSSSACFALGGNASPNSSTNNTSKQTTYKFSNIDDLNNLRELSSKGDSFEGKTIILKMILV